MNTRKPNRDSTWVTQGIDGAAGLVVSKDFLPTYLTVQMQSSNEDVISFSNLMSRLGGVIGNEDLMSSELTVRRNIQAIEERVAVTPEQWAKGFQTVIQKPKAIALFETAIAAAQAPLAASPAELRDTLPDKPEFPAECSAAYRRAREHLVSNPQSPRWLSLLLFTLARAIGSNATSSFRSDTWHEGTFFWFQIEEAWLQADGTKVGQLLLYADKELFGRNVAAILGTDMPLRLADSASNAPAWSLFHPPW